MLPFDDKRLPTIHGASDDMSVTAKKSAMSRMVKAIQSGDTDQALDAFSDLVALLDD